MERKLERGNANPLVPVGDERVSRVEPPRLVGEGGKRRLRSVVLGDQSALPRVAPLIAEHEPDEHAHVRGRGGQPQGVRGVLRLQGQGDPEAVGRTSLVAVLGYPNRDIRSFEPSGESLSEAADVAQPDGRPADWSRRRETWPRRVRMLRPGVETNARPDLGEKVRETGWGVAVLDTVAARRVATMNRRLTDRDEGVSVGALDALVDRIGQAGVGRRRNRMALAVVLGGEELLEVRLVPHREESDRRVPRVPARIPVGQRVGEVLQVTRVGRSVARLLASVRPGRRSPDREQQLDAQTLGVAGELVHVVEPVRRVERVGRVRGPASRRLRPDHRRADDRRSGLPCRDQVGRAVLTPAKSRVILEADEEPAGHRILRKSWRRGSAAAKENRDDRCSRSQQQGGGSAETSPHAPLIPARRHGHSGLEWG